MTEAPAHRDRLRPVTNGVRSNIHQLVWHKRTEEDPAQRWFRELVLECAKRVTASGLS